MRLPIRAQSSDAPPGRGGERRPHGAHQERVGDAHAVQGLAKDAGLQAGDVDGDIG